MSERVTMPALGESVTEGTVTRWLKNVGDEVAVDEPLLEVSTDKVDTEIPSPVAGTLQEILVAEDETVPVGAELAVIGDAAAAPAESSASEEEPAEETSAPAPADQEAPPKAKTEEPLPAAQAPVAEAPPAEAPAEASGEADASGTTVTMPALGESVTEGTVTRWLKAVGEQVEVDEPLLEVSTDKVDTEIPSPMAGTVTKILVGEDETVAVGADLVIIGGQAGQASLPAAPAAPAEPSVEAAEPLPAATPVPATPAPAPATPPAPAPATPPAPPHACES